MHLRLETTLSLRKETSSNEKFHINQNYYLNITIQIILRQGQLI